VTIIVAFKASDGVILGADGASLVPVRQEDGTTRIIHIFETATKIFQIGDKPVGVAFWGSGSIGTRTLNSLVAQFNRTKLPELQPHECTVSTLAEGLFVFLSEFHKQTFGPLREDEPDARDTIVGALLCGYSPDKYFGEGFEFGVPFRKPEQVWDSPSDMHPVWRGQIEPLARLISGYAPQLLEDILPMLTEKLGEKGVDKFVGQYQPLAVFGAMPLQEALELVRWMLRTTIGYFRFAAGARLCGGEIDTALITPFGYEWKDHKEIR
jgi:hypothetical protein